MVLTTPILEGLDGVNKMSKSLGNAIGIHEPPLEMYGKIMSISDEMMWRYYELLTDVRAEQIAALKEDAKSGKSHPMELKKELARSIVADFHSSDAATKAGEDWAKQFQKGGVPEEIETVQIRMASIAVTNPQDHKKPDWAAEEETRKMICLPDEDTVRRNDPNIECFRVEKLLQELGLSSSVTEGSRKLKEGAVTINGEQMKGRYFGWVSLPAEAIVKMGRKQKRASIVHG